MTLNPARVRFIDPAPENRPDVKVRLRKKMYVSSPFRGPVADHRHALLGASSAEIRALLANASMKLTELSVL